MASDTPAELRHHWGELVRQARTAAGLSQFDVALALHIPQVTISRWERGVTAPTDQNRLAVAAVLGVNPNELFPYHFDGNGNNTEAA